MLTPSCSSIFHRLLQKPNSPEPRDRIWMPRGEAGGPQLGGDGEWLMVGARGWLINGFTDGKCWLVMVDILFDDKTYVWWYKILT